jgi:flavin reductase (DIM6/NTAB) family NADH-FMN oxidoreductase RutF
LRADVDFRRACSQFPTGVLVVTASYGGEDFGLTVNAFASLSVEPPQAIVCLARTSNTYTAVESAGTFGVNVLSAEQEAVARHFASKRANKLAATPFRRAPEGVPLLEGTAAGFLCEVVETLPRATHVIVIGRVLDATIDETRDPLLFHRSRLCCGRLI